MSTPAENCASVDTHRRGTALALAAPGMRGANLELGVLVQGPAVAVVERLLDMFREG